MRLSSKALGMAAIAVAALATGACSGGNKAANNAAAAMPINTSIAGNDASAMESIGTPSTNTIPELPPVAEPTRNSTAPAGNGAAPRSEAPSGSGRVESNVSGM